MTLLKFFGYALILIVVQAAMVALLFISSGNGELPLLIIVYAYFPSIFIVQSTGNFVGCANMVQPFLLGVPIGIVAYSLIGSLMITAIIRLIRARA